MKREKGFTLLELLSVILVIAIIALIAMPIILNVIEDARKQASLRSAEGYLDAVEKAVLKSKIDNKKIENGKYFVKNGDLYADINDSSSSIKVDVKGTLPANGDSIEITKGEVTNCSLTISDYPISCNSDGKLSAGKKGEILVQSISVEKPTLQLYSQGSEQIKVNILPEKATDKTLTYNSSNPKIATVSNTGLIKALSAGEVKITITSSNNKKAEVNLKVLPKIICNNTGTTGTAIGTKYSCNPGDGIERTFYVLETSGENVSLLMDRNIKDYVQWAPDGNTTETGPVTANSELKTATSKWIDVSVVLPTANQIAVASGNTSWDGKDLTNIPTWLYENLSTNTGQVRAYWTSTPSTAYNVRAWFVYKDTGYGRLAYYTFVISSKDRIGIRPVITIPITSLQ